MNYAKINKHDIANGPGVRVSLFVSGCRNHCKGCFNPETWNFSYGMAFTMRTIDEILEALAPEHIAGLSILGGDPFEPENIIGVSMLIHSVKDEYPEKKIWVYTGYLYDELQYLSIMEYIDVLVDGPFIGELKDISLRFRGSGNQRIIDVPATRRSGKIKLWREE